MVKDVYYGKTLRKSFARHEEVLEMPNLLEIQKKSCLLYTSDPIADMLTRIRNANNAKHDTVDVPASNMKKAIAQILLDEGYIKNFQIINDGTQGVIRVTLKYLQPGKEKVLTGLRRVSKPGLRVYAGADELPQVCLLYTSQGEADGPLPRRPPRQLEEGHGHPDRRLQVHRVLRRHGVRR